MKKFTLVAALLLVSVLAFAQKPVKFGVYVGYAIPMGDMGQGDEIKTTGVNAFDGLDKYALMFETGKQGYADMGFGVGFDVTVALPVEGLGIFGGLDFFYNTNSSYITDAYADWGKVWVATSPINAEYQFTAPNFMNIPVLFGVNYQHNFNHIIGIFGEAGVGPNFRMISSGEETFKYVGLDDEKITYSYDSATTLGFKVGAGVMMWDKMSIVLDYYSLGSASIKGTAKGEFGNTSIENKFAGKNDISASELVVRVGYHF
ncbi:MAG: outer membrane beta-barrel protein [Bacteroidales bacterium]|nr:outer membrane beta-barrel protein [Bacteroidales bacterium]